MSSICGLCHEQGTGCCEFHHPDELSCQFGLTQGEIDEIIQHTGLKESDFIVEDTISLDYYMNLILINSIFEVVYRGMKRKKLITINNKCIFLTDSGCSLRAESRPIYCRMFPFWITEGTEKLLLIPSEYCLAQKNATNLFQVLRKFEIEKQQLQDIYQKLIDYTAQME